MSIFKCKMCGGTIDFNPGDSVGVCDSCGTKQTLPRLDDDRRANLYDRANHFRRNNEFDKAMGIYEQILNEDTSDAEAYWSLVLCRYGIEYVEDPTTHKRVPTVNRTQFTSIFDDEDYKSALQHADGYQREIYESEANAINEIQKGILAISQKEDPFDVFICYKETDASGRRTQDSVLANDLYHQLTNEGFKVFFSRITLEDKLGTAYEPYIFAALNSSKVMVVLGTKPEYFNAVWVKNEWSRYLSLVKQSGGKKVLIPAYRDMDPYDLPEEFSHLQAQDMSKLGFMQDLIHGIKKIAKADEPKQTLKETVVIGGNANVEPLLKRAFMFLEDGNWSEADSYCEKVLDQDPENAQAYLGKLMAELQIRRQEDLPNCEQPFNNSNNYQKAVRFGDEKLAGVLSGYIDHINERNENNRLKSIYNKAVTAMNGAKNESAFKSAAKAFKTIPGFQDADALSEQCLERAEVCRKDEIYASARKQMIGNDVSGYEAAIEAFSTISGWKNAEEQISVCQRKIEEIKAEDEQKRIQDAKNKKIKTKKIIIGSSIIAVCAIVLVVLFTVIIPTTKYNNFIKLKNQFKSEADNYLANGNNIQAAIYYTKAGEPLLAKSAYDFSTKLATTWAASAGVSNSNKLYYAADRSELKGANISDISSISSFHEYDGIVGLNSSGKVVMQNDGIYYQMRETVLSWENIKQLELGVYQTFALLEDGTVVGAFCETNSEHYYPVNPSYKTWKNIVKIGTHYDDLWGIDKNGQFYYATSLFSKPSSTYDLSLFSSVKKVVFYNSWLIGLTTDGKLVYTPDRYESDIGTFPIDISNLEGEVKDIVVSDYWLLILKSDGTVVSARYDKYSSSSVSDYSSYIAAVQRGFSRWKSIVYIQPVVYGFAGVDINGNVFYQSTDYTKPEGATQYTVTEHPDVESVITSWKDIVYISSYLWGGYYDEPEKDALGLHSDGTVSSLNTGKYLTLEKNSDGELNAKVHLDGVHGKTDSWKLW